MAPKQLSTSCRERNRLVNSISTALSLGDGVEVYYTIRMGGERAGKNVWWPGVVSKATYTTEEAGNSLAITVKFEARLDEDQESVTFKVVNWEDVIDSNGNEYNWKRVTFKKMKRMKMTEEEDENDGDHKNENEDTPNEEISSGLQETVSCLQQQLKVLEGKVRTSERRIAQLEEPFVHENISPLKRRLALYLNEFLRKKPMAGTPSYTDLAGSGLYKQAVFSAKVDCTLSQFDSIAWDVKHEWAKGKFYPAYEEFQRVPRSHGKIVFNGFEDIAGFFGIVGSDVKKHIVVTKEKKNQTQAIHVIGTFSSGETDNEPLLICAGGDITSWSSQSMYAARETLKWNDAEDAFVETLNICNEEEHVELINAMSVQEHEIYEFGLEWKAVDWEEGGYANTYARRDDVMGVAVLLIPYVVIRTTSACEELLSIWTTFQSNQDQ